MSSSGLSSGNHRLEALSHGICELVERDAMTLWRASSEAEQRRTRVDLATVDDPACRDVLAAYARAGVDVLVWETTSDVGIPAFACTIVDQEPNPRLARYPTGRSRRLALDIAGARGAPSR